ncbi:phytanoyl-CoA dioxygenase, peroxisomal-like [Rhodnius prolixus]|uniref:phytanoyl-CoA dioxygenase n=2 Tax=Rhodnius TaxID=13248 RepID=R4G806_RHOPR
MASERLQVVYRHLSGACPKLNLIQAEKNNLNSYQDGFRYTLHNPLLNYEQRRFYEENGYIVIPRLIEDSILDECCQRFVDYCDGVIPRGMTTLMKDISLAKKGAKGVYLYNKIQDILFDDVFEKYFLHPQLLDYVSCFTGPNIKGMHSMLINKPPDSGALTSRHPLHQDLYYFPFRPADRIVAAWTAMEPVTTSNGCLVVLPGTHMGELLQHDYPNWEGGVNKAYHGIRGCDDYETVPLPMDKGDTVFFHPLLIHGSGANITSGFRKAISCHYSTSDSYFIDVRGTVQDKIAKEIEEMSAAKGYSLTIQEVWQYRSRPVKGFA